MEVKVSTSDSEVMFIIEGDTVTIKFWNKGIWTTAVMYREDFITMGKIAEREGNKK